ncbi:SRPBCC family protein [Gelidibacter salicanalis]|nr:SRPBCC domain-containing protein [Gelidibacter salicanalis]
MSKKTDRNSMEQKTKVFAEDGKQEIQITRHFDLPVESLYNAFVDKDLFAQWMGSDLIEFEFKQYGKYHFEKRNPKGDVIFNGKGTFHGFIPNTSIVRTFEMDVFSLPAQLEFLDFKSLTDETSKLTMHVIFKSVEIRNELLKKPFAQGLNMAHNKLEEIIKKV